MAQRHKIALTSGHLSQQLKYSWQREVLEALMEVRPECVPGKIKAAKRAISKRLCDQKRAPDLEEHAALHGAFRSLMRLLADQTIDKQKPGAEEIA